jgi:hypothetical protein
LETRCEENGRGAEHDLSPNLTTGSLTVCIFAAQAAVVHNDLLISDIVTETEPPKPQPVCSLSGRNSFQFFDGVLPAAVIGIGAQDREHLGKNGSEVSVPSCEMPEQALKMRGRADKE